jgi:hypothetical protein
MRTEQKPNKKREPKKTNKKTPVSFRAEILFGFCSGRAKNDQDLLGKARTEISLQVIVVIWFLLRFRGLASFAKMTPE